MEMFILGSQGFAGDQMEVVAKSCHVSQKWCLEKMAAK